MKRIELMIQRKRCGDAKEVEMIAFLIGYGFRDNGGTKHRKMERPDKGPFKTKVVMVPRARRLRRDQVRYILKQIGFM